MSCFSGRCQRCPQVCLLRIMTSLSIVNHSALACSTFFSNVAPSFVHHKYFLAANITDCQLNYGL